MLDSASHGNNVQSIVKFAGTYHALHADVARDYSDEDEDGVSALLHDDVGVLMASTGGDIDRLQSEQIGDVVDPVPTTSLILLFQLLFLNCSASAFLFPVYNSFMLSFWIASCDCAFKAMSVRLA